MNQVSLAAVHRAHSAGARKVSAGKTVAFKSQQSTDSTEFLNTTPPPKIGRLRLLFSRLTNKQIKAVNESSKLPKNAKFMGGITTPYIIGNNFFGIRKGTQILPAGFELKKGFLGFTKVVPKGTKGLFIRDAK